MRKIFVLLLVCGLGASVFGQEVLTLDEALNNSTVYLKGRIPAGSKVVVLNFTSKWTDLTEYAIEELTGYIVNDGVFTVVDRANLEAIRKEMDFQLSGEVSDATAQSIGQKLGAQTIISGSISAIGNAYRLRIRAIAVETAQIQGLQNVDVRQDSRIAALTGTAYNGPASVSRPAAAATTAAATKPAQTAPVASSAQSGSYISLAGWKANKDSKSSADCNVSTENIDGASHEVLTMMLKVAANSWGNIQILDTPATRMAQSASGLRFKVYGDGKPWRICVGTSDINDGCYHELKFSTKKNAVTEIDVPYSKLKQPSWGKKMIFKSEKINLLQFRRDSAEDGTTESTLKVFNFEFY